MIAWPERFNHDELSAIQHAMNLKLQDERAFWAEYQNEPLARRNAEDEELDGRPDRGEAQRLEPRRSSGRLQPPDDVYRRPGRRCCSTSWLAWEDDFTGYVIDYGAYPDQKRPYFTLRDAQPTLCQAATGAGLEGAIYAGLEALTQTAAWTASGSATTAPVMRIERCLIDANWGSSTDVVYQFCRHSAQLGGPLAQPRPVRRRVQHAVFRIQAEAGRPRRTELANS